MRQSGCWQTSGVERAIRLAAVWLCFMVLSGCESLGLWKGDVGSTPAATQPSVRTSDAEAAKTAQEYANRVKQAMQGRANVQGGGAGENRGPEEGDATAIPTVRWVDAQALSTPAPISEPPATQPAVPGAGAIPGADRESLVRQLRSTLSSATDPPMLRALAAAGLSLADPRKQMSEGDLAGLTAGQRQVVLRYQQLVLELGRQLAQNNTPIAADTLTRLLEPAADEGLKITTAKLCRRVKGFGVYDAFEGENFLAGKEQRMIVYEELEHFKTVTNAGAAGGKYQVKLKQEVTLLTQADGAEVWRQAPVQILDESHNVRKDFFVVQLIELPAKLGTGKYVLKVRVTDEQGGSVDETSIALTLVADQSLVSRPGR